MKMRVNAIAPQRDAACVESGPTPSPPAEGGEGWGEEGRGAFATPLSPALSPLVPRGARETVAAVAGCVRVCAWHLWVAIWLVAFLCAPVRAHESPVDHVDRTLTLWVQDGRVFVACRLQLILRMALLQFHEADADRDGVVSERERARVFEATAERLRGLLRAEVGGRALVWDGAVRVTLEPGLAQRFVLSAPLGDAAKGAWAGRLSDGFSGQYPGHYRFLNTGEIPAGAQRVVADFAPETERVAGGHPARVVVKFTLAVTK